MNNFVRTDDYLFEIGGNFTSEEFPYLIIEVLGNGELVPFEVCDKNDWDYFNQYKILAHLPLGDAPVIEGIKLVSPEKND